MADSVDRVFSKAITTVKTLSVRSGYGSFPRPPNATRNKLYGLYKQATDGDIPPQLSDQLFHTTNNIDDEMTLKKYEAWYANYGMSQTEAKKRYIETLIDTMKEYASGTMESRELLNELEYLYDQIKDLRIDSNDENESLGGGLDPTILKSPELLYNAQFQYPGHHQAVARRNLSSSTNNLLDMRSVYDRNDSLASIQNNNGSNTPDPTWKNEINSVINKMIKDLNFFKKLERQRQNDAARNKRYGFMKFIAKLFGYSIVNILVLILLLKWNQKKKFLNKIMDF